MREPNPGLLNGILGFPVGTQDAIGNRTQVRAFLLKFFGQPIALGHLHKPMSHSALVVRRPDDGQEEMGVTGPPTSFHYFYSICPQMEERQMKIKLASVYVGDQDKALRFYTEVLGFAKKADFTQGPFRWLTVVSPEDPNATELQLAKNDNPAAKTYQEAMFREGQPAVLLFSDNVKSDYERIKSRGAEFVMAPTEVPGATIAKLNDTWQSDSNHTARALVGWGSGSSARAGMGDGRGSGDRGQGRA
jgi:predicted enzyme related to lactoylglutathione lyase